MQFRIAHNLVDIPAADHLQTYNSRKGNAAKFRVPYARTVAYMHSSFPDVTRMWNALLSDMVTACSKKTIYAHGQSPSINTHHYSSSFVLVHHSKLNIVVPARACGNKLKVVIIMLICI